MNGGHPGAMSARRRPSGFALLTVIALIAIIGMAVVGMSGLFAAEAARTRDGVRDAQVRQLLLAGAVEAPGAVAGWDGKGEKDVTVKLPGELAGDGGSLSVRVRGGKGGAIEAEVAAEFEGRRGWQTLMYARQGQAVKLVGADLGE